MGEVKAVEAWAVFDCNGKFISAFATKALAEMIVAHSSDDSPLVVIPVVISPKESE